MSLQKIKEDAISPVVGVLLMLVVTIIIAAVITAFATGMAGDSTSATPMAFLEAENPQMKEGGTQGQILNTFDLIHNGGDEIALENIQVVVEIIGGEQSGMVETRIGEQLKVLGRSDNMASAGNVIRISYDKTTTTMDDIDPGNQVKWTVSDIRTNGVIAKGDFFAPQI